ncbi:hypothetical protein PV392_07380 [Streptomyces sp. ME03-5709C]|nr:hypothetical protein [Streptomyces sp. ME03-5709C]
METIAGAELPGYHRIDAAVWTNDHGDLVSVHWFDTPPDIPAPLEELPRLRHALAHYTAVAGGGLIEADVLHLGTVPSLRQVIKVPLPDRPAGQAFLGSYTLPRASCSAVVKVQALEQGTTGAREARVLGELGPERYFMPHPYAPDLRQGLPFHWGDAPHYDAHFPAHPLTRVRDALAQLAFSLQVAPEFAALAPFTGPVTTA